MAQINDPARFDRIARLYRWMEYLSFGRALERCRFFFLPVLADSRRALILGDGDGRFTARLLRMNSQLHADAVDASPAMLHLLRRRAAGSGTERRLTTLCADARTLSPASAGYDLVVTHFFLDCLTEEEVSDLIARLCPHLASGCRWIVSEFQIPVDRPVRAWVCRAVIRFLYLGFRLLTGLTVQQIPPWPTLLSRSGFERVTAHAWPGGLLLSEMWEFRQATGVQAR